MRDPPYAGGGEEGWVWDDCSFWLVGWSDEWWLKAGLGTLAAPSVLR